MKAIVSFAAAVVLALPAFGGEKVAGTNYFVGETKSFPTGEKTGYFINHSPGISRSTTGPLGTVPIDCHGAGYWDETGAGANGICLAGGGDDTWTLSWERAKGTNDGTWKIISGKGKFAGMTGQGTYSNTTVSANRSISDWEGEVTLP